MRLLQPLIAAAFSFLLLIVVIAPETTQGLKKGRHRVELAPDQSFSGAAGSTIEYNIYINNGRGSITDYTLSALSNQGYHVEVWRDTDFLNGGDIQLIPPQRANITLNAREVATLIVRVTIPTSTTDGMVDVTIIEVENTNLGISDSVTLTTAVNTNLPYPSDWIQLGSDSLEDPSHPKKADTSALYYANNGTHVFFRMAEVDTPTPISFLYIVYMDTKADGQQIGSYQYDYSLSSDGTLYEWNGTGLVDSGSPTNWWVDGNSIVLCSDLDSLVLDTQDIQILSQAATKDMKLKDDSGPYTIARENIPEIPLALIPFVSLAIFLAVSRKRLSFKGKGL